MNKVKIKSVVNDQNAELYEIEKQVILSQIEVIKNTQIPKKIKVSKEIQVN